MIGHGENSMKTQRKFAHASLLLLLLAVIPTDGSARKSEQKQPKKTVYVCACLKTKSCSCMTEAKMQGPCACGTEGGPPMKEVPADSDWAKENREALAK
jgi:hypothetical protein